MSTSGASAEPPLWPWKSLSVRSCGAVESDEVAPVVAALAPHREAGAVGRDRHVGAARRRVARGLAGVDVEHGSELGERCRGAVQARAAHVATGRVGDVGGAVDRHVDRGRGSVGPELLRREHALPRRAHDRVEVRARDEGDGEPPAGGGGHDRLRAGVAEPRVDALGRLPGAVGQARDEDVVGPAVLLDVDDGAGAVAGHVDVAHADEVGARAVDDLAGEKPGVGGGRRGQRDDGGDDGDQTAWQQGQVLQSDATGVTTPVGGGSFGARSDGSVCGRRVRSPLYCC